MIVKNVFLAFVALFISGTILFAQEGFRAEVVNTNGDPIKGALVKEVNDAWQGVTDENGYAVIKGVTAGSYVVHVTAEGYDELVKPIRTRSIAAPEVHFVMYFESSEMPGISVIEKKNGLFTNTPGSLVAIDQKTIRQIAPLNGNEVLRQVSGVHIAEEEGMGLRINIGIRGLNPDKSRSVLVMEDGVPVALAPYGEPEMYYTPAMDRMEGVEVLKGSGSILHGPQTIGGVVNFITKDPTKNEYVNVNLQGGQGDLFSGLFMYGNTYGKTGVMISALRKQADGIGMLKFDFNDVNAKLRFQTSERSSVGLKLGFYNEVSNATYVGLTQDMFENGNDDFLRIAPDDQLNIRRYSASMTHKYLFNDNTKLQTTLFGYTTTRNWRRQDFAYNKLDENGVVTNYPENFSGTIWGDTTVTGGAILMRNSTGNRNRQFEVLGAESRFIKKYKFLGIENEFIGGGRLLYERAFEQRVNGTNTTVSSGDLRNMETRTGYGTSLFLHNSFKLNTRLSLSAGVRAERFDYQRDIQRLNFVDSLISENSSATAFIPGLGFAYNLNEKLVVFGGVHRGFAPPRLKDAITDDGQDARLGAELSWNYELGFRGQLLRGLRTDLTFFYMDFENQVIPVAESSGGFGAGLINGGSTMHAGIEFSTVLELHKFINLGKEKLALSANYTFVKAEFTGNRFVGGEDVAGNRTPYAPEHLINGAITYESRLGIGVRLAATHVSEQYTDPVNSVEPSASGRNGKIDAYTIFDATFMYNVKKWNTTFTLSAKNITDERYVATRRPQGIRVGNPRLLMVGVRWELK